MKDVVFVPVMVYASVYVVPLTVRTPFVVVAPCVATIFDVPLVPLMSRMVLP
jgi:hypothetical protein